MIRLCLFFAFFAMLDLNAQNESQNSKVNILLVIGGHSFDTLAFFQMWDQMPNIEYTVVKHPKANELLISGGFEKYDAIVFYDMWNKITDSQKTAWQNLVKKGKGLVFLHHSIVSYQNWDFYLNLVGGRYHDSTYIKNGVKQPASDYTHDLEMHITVADKNHPITKGIDDFTIEDEAYGNLEVMDQVHTLLNNNHPKASPMAMWTNESGKSRIVYLALGHDAKAFQNQNYKLLIARSVNWVRHKL